MIRSSYSIILTLNLILISTLSWTMQKPWELLSTTYNYTASYTSDWWQNSSTTTKVCVGAGAVGASFLTAYVGYKMWPKKKPKQVQIVDNLVHGPNDSLLKTDKNEQQEALDIEAILAQFQKNNLFRFSYAKDEELLLAEQYSRLKDWITSFNQQDPRDPAFWLSFVAEIVSKTHYAKDLYGETPGQRITRVIRYIESWPYEKLTNDNKKNPMTIIDDAIQLSQCEQKTWSLYHSKKSAKEYLEYAQKTWEEAVVPRAMKYGTFPQSKVISDAENDLRDCVINYFKEQFYNKFSSEFPDIIIKHFNSALIRSWCVEAARNTKNPNKPQWISFVNWFVAQVTSINNTEVFLPGQSVEEKTKKINSMLEAVIPSPKHKHICKLRYNSLLWSWPHLAVEYVYVMESLEALLKDQGIDSNGIKGINKCIQHWYTNCIKSGKTDTCKIGSGPDNFNAQSFFRYVKNILDGSKHSDIFGNSPQERWKKLLSMLEASDSIASPLQVIKNERQQKQKIANTVG